MEIIAGAGVFAPVQGAPAYAEQLRTGDLSFGTYSLPAGGADTQSPHGEDEIYVIVSGRATFWTPARTVSAVPGSAIFVPAREPHRFTDITEDLTALVFFGPAEGSRRTPLRYVTELAGLRCRARGDYRPRCKIFPR